MPMIDVAVLGADVVWREHRTSDRVVPLICTTLSAFAMTILACPVHSLTSSFCFPANPIDVINIQYQMEMPSLGDPCKQKLRAHHLFK